MAAARGCACVSCQKENNGSERANYGFMGGDLIFGKVPHILSADCRSRSRFQMEATQPVVEAVFRKLGGRAVLGQR